MTPGARVAAAIEVLDQWLEGRGRLEPLLRAWGRAHRFAGSKDRRAIADHVYECVRRKRSLAARSGAVGGRGLLHGLAMEQGWDVEALFSGARHHPPLLKPEETVGLSLEAAADPVRLDHPDWMTPHLISAFGDAYETSLQRLRERAPLDLRVNTVRGSRENAMAALREDGVDTQIVPGAPTAMRAKPGATVTTTKAFRDGLIEVQDAASQQAALAVGEGGDVLDFCAGAGGKALAIAAALRPGARIVAHDVDPSRMKDLPARAARSGASIEIADLAALKKMARAFDTVFVDAPCSGSGTWRRDVEAKWRLTPEGLEAVVALQARVLDEAAGFVREGGRLIYATCSLFRCENEDQIAAFLRRAPGFTELKATRLAPCAPGDGFFFVELSARPPS